MRIKIILALLFPGLLLHVSGALAEPVYVEVQAVLGSTAVLKINGQRQSLRVGETVSGVTLLTTDGAMATVEFDGRKETLGLSSRIGTHFEVPTEQVITIARDRNNQYLTSALINGRSARVLVDTGANVVAMSTQQASALGINYKDGQPGQVQTASGLNNAFMVNLPSVSVGGIKAYNIRASVLEGDYPVTILLGMTYLRHVKIQEHNGILSLSRMQ